MPVRVKCTLGIGGRLTGPPEDNQTILAELREILPESPPLRAGAGWPNGVVCPDWHIAFWDCAAEIGGKQDLETRITFRMELTSRLDGTIYDCREALADTHFRRFSHYREELWHKHLKARLEELNEDIAKRFGAEKLIEKIWFREWQFWCGNGGDH